MNPTANVDVSMATTQALFDCLYAAKNIHTAVEGDPDAYVSRKLNENSLEN